MTILSGQGQLRWNLIIYFYTLNHSMEIITLNNSCVQLFDAYCLYIRKKTVSKRYSQNK